MSTQTKNYGLIKDDIDEFYDVSKVNNNLDKIDTQMKKNEDAIATLDEEVTSHWADSVYQTAGGTGTAVTLNISGTLVTGYPITFIASANNSVSATTINGKPLYKPGTTTAPKIITGKAYTVWYNATANNGNGCFFIKASATGTVTPDKVLAGEIYSTEEDTDLVGTMPNIGAITIKPSKIDIPIPKGWHDGNGKVQGDTSIMTNTTAGDTVSVPIGRVTSTSKTMTLVKEIQMIKSGTVRIKYKIGGSSGSSPSFNSQIYINGIPTGVLRTTNGTYSEDFSVNENDKIQLYAKNISYTSSDWVVIDYIQLCINMDVVAVGIITI